MSDITFTSSGRIIIKRPKHEVIAGMIKRTQSEGTFEINFKLPQPKKDSNWKGKPPKKAKVSPKLMPPGLPSIEQE
jgi:hypothetical protein